MPAGRRRARAARRRGAGEGAPVDRSSWTPSPGERIMRPAFGCGLRRYLMEPNTVATRTAIQQDVRARAAAWEPRIQLTGVERRQPARSRRCVESDLLRPRLRRPARQPRLPVLPGAMLMALTSPILDDRSLRAAAGRTAAADPGLHPGVDRPQRERPRDRPPRAVRLPRRVLLYRFNQIPETTKLEFLRLLQHAAAAGQARGRRWSPSPPRSCPAGRRRCVDPASRVPPARSRSRP